MTLPKSGTTRMLRFYLLVAIPPPPKTSYAERLLIFEMGASLRHYGTTRMLRFYLLVAIPPPPKTSYAERLLIFEMGASLRHYGEVFWEIICLPCHRCYCSLNAKAY
jgi:hypothetical protein